jgi:tetratricopeptide (TPR) repeat protein
MSNETRAAGLVRRAEALWTVGRYEASIEFAEQALALDPEYFSAHLSRSNALLLHGNYLEALESANNCCRIDPQRAVGHRLRSAILEHLDRGVESVESAKRAVAVDTTDAASYCQLCDALTKARQLDEALAAIHQGKLLAPELPRVHLAEGNVHLKQENYELAEASYRTALELDPEMTAAKFNLAIVFRNTDRPQEALELAHALMIHDPGDKANLNAFAWHGEAFVQSTPLHFVTRLLMGPGVPKVFRILVPVLKPLAWFESRKQWKLLPKDMRSAIVVAEKMSDVGRARRDVRNANFRVVSAVLQLIAIVAVTAVVLYLIVQVKRSE